MNAETKHTPRPWILRDRTGTIGNPAMQIEGPQGEVIARVIYQDGFGTLKANANLLIAAPDLLEACKAAREYIYAIEPEDGRMSEQGRVILSLNAAIEKASAL